MKKILLYFSALMLFYSGLRAQETFPVNGMRDKRVAIYAFTHATIFTDYQTKMEDATLLIQGEKILEVGKNVVIPKEAVVTDLKGMYIYPSFIDLHTYYGLPEVKTGALRDFTAREQITPKPTGPYNANESIKASYNAVEEFKVDDKSAQSMRELGFGSVLSLRPDGIARGSSVLVTLSDEVENKVVLNRQAAAHYSFEKGSSTQTYPISIMGFVALLRQTYLDAEWYKGAKNENFADLTLESWNTLQSLPQLFEVRGRLNLVRADKIGDEFGKQYIIKGSGDEYQRIEEIKATQASLIIPLNFPQAYDISDPYDAMRISLQDMMHWEQAPTNPAVLERNGIEFSLTSHGLKNKKDFWKNLRTAIEMGLTETAALKALTFNPAKQIKAEQMLGSLSKGKFANFLISSGNIFAKDSKIYENWIQGKAFSIKRFNEKDYRGIYTLSLAQTQYKLEVSGEVDAFKLKVFKNDTIALKTMGSISNDLITLNFKPDESPKSESGYTRLSGWITDKTMSGQGQLNDGTWTAWNAAFSKALEEKPEKKKEEAQKPKIGTPIYPFTAFGSTQPPQKGDFLIQKATVWTNEAEGIVQETDVLVKNGKIAQIGKNLTAGGATVIDGKGKHLTSGIIDEHSHIALSSVNDVATVSSMVRMEDAVDPEDIDIYRQLAGGVTASQLLHGSANPVGGQSAIIKMRWGMPSKDLLIQGAPKFIKFALGENVKRSSNRNSIRYPLTRMGVEQVYVEAFTRAQEYDQAWQAFKKDPKNPKPRRDLELEALVEILKGERFITCHSYVQSEINMMMKVAEMFNFRINTFTHILEGYKVADKMKTHGAGGSTFSDWWAYKFEVKDAIPYNPLLMTKEGVVTAINSDDAEMGRRLNQEAGKSVKYGGMSQEDAWKMVTLNPAKLLHLDKQMGSIKVGKDADLVLWSDNPLSIYARAEKTMVDGTIYYDVEQDKILQASIQEERNRLMQKMNDAKGNGAAAEVPSFNGNHSWHCDDVMGFEDEDFEK